MSEQLRSLRHERDLLEHGAAVTTRPWWVVVAAVPEKQPSWIDHEIAAIKANPQVSWPFS